MGATRRLLRTAGLALVTAGFSVVAGDSAPTPDKPDFTRQLKAVRTAVQQNKQRQQVPAKPIRVAAVESPKPQSLSVDLDLGAVYNKHLRSTLKFNANGWNVYASAGLNPDNPDGDYLILRVEDKANIVFDIRQMITLTTQWRGFEINKTPIVLIGSPVFKWGNPERDSTLAVALNENPHADAVERAKDPKVGDEPKYLLKPFSMIEFRRALWNVGTPVNIPGAEVRFYYGDAVIKGERRLMVGEKKGFAFFHKIGEDKFSKAVLLGEDKLAIGNGITISLAKDLMIRVVRVDENTLRVTKENPTR